MSFFDVVKRSLGFEENINDNKTNDFAHDLRPEYYDDFTIAPEQSLYELVLIRPKSIDDINYVVDQIVNASNPVILDLSFLKKESESNYKLAMGKLKFIKEEYNARVVLLARCGGKDLVIVTPNNIDIVNRG